jgi:signal transduction histidine kinase
MCWYARGDGALMTGSDNEPHNSEYLVASLNLQTPPQSAENFMLSRPPHEENNHLIKARSQAVYEQTAAEIAHNVNNLLTVVSCNLQIIRTTVSAREILRTLDQATTACELAARANAVLFRPSYCRRSNRPLNASQFFASITAMLRQILGTEIELRWRCIGDSPALVAVERDALHQATINIAINARDAMPGGGSFDIEVSQFSIASDDSSPLHGLQPGPYVQIAFSDSGCGMSLVDAKLAIEPHMTSKTHGSGLGLPSICKFASASGGAVNIVTELGKGTEIQLVLPAHG